MTTEFTLEKDRVTEGYLDPYSSLAIQTYVKIVARGYYCKKGPDYYAEYPVIDIALARYNTNGTLDSTFSEDGKLTIDFGGFDQATSLAIQNDGKIVVEGLGSTSSNRSI